MKGVSDHDKLKTFIKRIRWKPFFFEKKTVTINFGFKSVKTPPKNEQLSQFESDFYDMVQNIEFRKVIYSSKNLFNNQHYSNY